MIPFSIRIKFFLSHFIAILLVSGSIGSYFYQSALEDLTNSLKSRLKYSAAILSHSFTPSELDLIHDASVVDSQSFQTLLTKIRDLSNANSDIAFIYVMRMTDNAVEFVIDSDPNDPASPGDVYAEHIPELVNGFTELSVDSAITTDRWGSFMSGYAPIKGGHSPYLIGIDMRADEVKSKLEDLKTKGLLSLLSAILLAYISSHFLSNSMIKRIKALHNQCMQSTPVKNEVSKNNKGDELDDLSHAFNFMLDSIQKEHNYLEKQVQSRMNELHDTNQKLSEEIEERKRMEKIINESATTDYLTGLANRRKVTGELDKVLSSNKTYSIILIDIDHFKEINDTHGHDVGDKILRRFARFLLHNVNKTSTVGRWGGEEFVLLMPNTNASTAMKEAERVRTLINNENLAPEGQTKKLTASFGVAENEEKEAWETVIKRADVALYRAKHAGRNQTVLAEESIEAI